MQYLAGKVIFITGATKGIGYATAELAAKEGCTLILNGRDREVLEEVEQLLQRWGSKIYIFDYDVRDLQKIKQVFNWIKKEIGYIDILVNNAGVMKDSPLGMLTLDTLYEMIDVNLVATLNHMQYASRVMRKSQSPSIINITSIIAQRGAVGQIAYSATKSAIIGATKSAAKELAPIGIRVNAVSPGYIQTDMVENYKVSKIVNSIGLARAGEASEVAKVILFLGSESSSYITGQVIGIDGGMVI